MARRLVVLFLVTCAYCMEMRETVERMVMVRTTGSDLQPAATGFIYKKDNDGPASVIKMGESEVMEHLSKIYEQPKSFTAPIPIAAGPFYAEQKDDKNAALISESKVIPVVEKQEEKDDIIDGLADQEYDKIFAEYASDFGNYDSDFNDYLKSLGHFEDGVYHGHGDDDRYGDNLKKGYGSKHQYKKGDAGDYHSEKYETYKLSGQNKHEKNYDDTDGFGRNYAGDHGHKGGNHGYESGQNKEKAGNDFYKIFDQNEYKKGHDFYDGDAIKRNVHKFDEGYVDHESDSGRYEEGGVNGSGQHASGLQGSGFSDKDSGAKYDGAESSDEEKESSRQQEGDFSAHHGARAGKSYGYAIKH